MARNKLPGSVARAENVRAQDERRTLNDHPPRFDVTIRQDHLGIWYVDHQVVPPFESTDKQWLIERLERLGHRVVAEVP